jgi:16S rRNA (cytosine967-C5)-methyltransferase
MNVLEERRTLDEALNLTRSFESLSGPDRGFARAMASAALRQLGRLQIGLAPFLNRSLDTATPPSRALLLIGVAQLWLMETPSHAGVGETVAAAKLWPRARQSAGFLNAVLRKATQNREAFDTAPPLSIWPDWLQDVASKDLGNTRAEQLAYAQMSEPNLHLTCKRDHIGEIEADFAAASIETERLPSGSLMVPSGAVDTYPRYAKGDWWVQDSAAALPAKLLSGGPEKVLVDLCAAPGGKTMQLAETSAKVYAVDRSAKRLARVEENLQRTQMTQRTVLVAEKGENWQPQKLGEKIDGILVDAPCSALGTLRRHPEGPWIKRKDDLDRYPDIQKRLLAAALDLVSIGGEVVYCVCSPFSNEGLDVVQHALKSGRVMRKPIQTAEVTGFAHCLSSEGDLLTLPGEMTHHDAFFIARLIRQN